MIYRLFSLLIATLSLQAARLSVEVSAPSAILINAETGGVLFEKGAHVPAYPASITKVATALYALEKKGQFLDAEAVATHDCVATVTTAAKRATDAKHPPHRLEVGGSNIGIRAGEAMSLRALFHGLLLSSGNDAANVIATYVSGDVSRFMEELNGFLVSKGIMETRFLNPHGLHHPDHRTTASDMALIAREALKHPFFREVVKTVQYARPPTNKQPEGQLVQSNRLLRPGTHFYPKAIGVKTGYTSLAGYTLVAAAEHEGRTLIAVLLGCEDANARYRDAIHLFETAFGQKGVTRTLLSAEFDRFKQELPGAAREVEAALGKDLTMTFYPAEEPNFQARLRWNTPRLPIAKGERVGLLDLVTDKGDVVRSEPIFASYDVRKTVWRALSDVCLQYRTLLLCGFLGLNIVFFLLHYLKKGDKALKG